MHSNNNNIPYRKKRTEKIFSSKKENASEWKEKLLLKYMYKKRVKEQAIRRIMSNINLCIDIVNSYSILLDLCS